MSSLSVALLKRARLVIFSRETQREIRITGPFFPLPISGDYAPRPRRLGLYFSGVDRGQDLGARGSNAEKSPPAKIYATTHTHAARTNGSANGASSSVKTGIYSIIILAVSPLLLLLLVARRLKRKFIQRKRHCHSMADVCSDQWEGYPYDKHLNGVVRDT